MDTLMNMPIQDRKFYIRRHNYEENEKERTRNKDKNAGTSTYEGEALNTFAKLEQSNAKVRGGKFN